MPVNSELVPTIEIANIRIWNRMWYRYPLPPPCPPPSSPSSSCPCSPSSRPSHASPLLSPSPYLPPCAPILSLLFSPKQMGPLLALEHARKRIPHT
jgi:hypothetical protein